MKTFTYNAQPSRVVFGSGTSRTVADEVLRLGRSRVLLLTGHDVAEPATEVARALGDLLVARFDGAAMHTPTQVTEEALASARAHDVDCVVSVGGGSTTGLSKALAVRAGYDQVIIPTTYAGSEVTPVLGETENGVKTTRSSADILPETVVYDVDLTVGLPPAITLTSAINAMAHAVEALYAPEANPVTDQLALEAIRGITQGLPKVMADPSDLDGRGELLQAAWLSGSCLAAVGMGVHHKLCHALGGGFDLPHSQMHTVILPYAMAYNAPAAQDVMRRIAQVMRVPDAAAGVHDLVASLGGPTSLAELGFTVDDIPKAAALATARPYPNPRSVTVDGISALLADAVAGSRPGGGNAFPRAELDRMSRAVVASFAGTEDPRLHTLMTDLVRRAHDFVTSNDLTTAEWEFAIDFLTRTGQVCSDVRQEFILLSDTLGISTMVDILTNSRVREQTPSAVLGPFYVEGPPAVRSGADLAEGLPGVPMWVDVAVTNPDGTPLPDAIVDVWQSNEDGFYDVQLPDLDGPVLRGQFRTDADGRLRFWTILPCEYPIPDDGPVGQMLDGVGRHPFRAPHVHFMISASGHRRLITQLFPSDGAYLTSDSVFGVKHNLIVDMPEHRGPTPDGRVVDGAWRRLDFTFRIAPDA
ncbi:alcohol dehydrogenase class IV [Rhodococcus sp. AG1013]|uniref:maleylacetate reductase and hydroxyquinol 1,2-dioxygenase domain-containing protein n=1 Tax=Rhodococcus sp. AG1013 TaxID=2183996 RepID=UPI000E0C47CF|nr:maleylacetate reductase and hydroxyquinol 1,2-dioxygenase domain-containing protein [Rhodococcus sp. AG1013]RDI12374.1 alcohol dehydrogenase class IV [Rhodococcus sp. AG1013]